MGGDGLAVARILFHAGYDCLVCMLTDKEDELSEECRYNLERLPKYVRFDSPSLRRFSIVRFSDLEPDAIIIDALLGSGVKGDLRELYLKLSIRLMDCRIKSYQSICHQV